MIKDKNFYRQKFKKTQLQMYVNLFKLKRREVKYELRHCERSYINNIESRNNSNSKAFFAYTKSINKSNKFPTKMSLGNDSGDDPKSITNLFSKHFNSVYSPIDQNIQLSNLDCNCANHIVVSDSEITRAIMSLDRNKTNSPDLIPILFFQKNSPSIIAPLKILFNYSIECRKFPSKWKNSLVTPIYKSGDEANISNYRPISITCAVSKIFEKNNAWAH